MLSGHRPDSMDTVGGENRTCAVSALSILCSISDIRMLDTFPSLHIVAESNPALLDTATTQKFQQGPKESTKTDQIGRLQAVLIQL